MALLMLKNILRSSLIFLLICAASTSAFAITKAGTAIFNQAEMTYFDTDAGVFRKVISNQSIVKVAPIFGVTIEPTQPNDPTQPGFVDHVAPGTLTNLPINITNSGNKPDQYVVEINQLTDDDGNLIDPNYPDELQVYVDSNGNGMVDPGELPLQKDENGNFITPTLQPGESIALVVLGQVPLSAEDGDTFNLETTVTSVNDPSITQSVLLQAVATTGPVINLTLSASELCTTPLQPGEEVSFTVSYVSNGQSGPVNNKTYQYQYGGQTLSQMGVLFTNTLPANLIIQPDKQQNNLPVRDHAPNFGIKDNTLLGGIVLVGLNPNNYANPTDDDLTWVDYGTWDGQGAAAKVGFLVTIDDVQPNHNGYFKYYSVVGDYNSLESFSSSTQSSVTYYDETGKAITASTEPLCSTFGSTLTNGDELLNFVTINTEVLPNSAGTLLAFDNDDHFIPTDFYYHDAIANFDSLYDGIMAEVNLPQANQDPSRRDIIGAPNNDFSVVLTSSLGDSLDWVMMETGPNTGIFRSVIPVHATNNTSDTHSVCLPDAFGGPWTTESYNANNATSDPNSPHNQLLRLNLYGLNGVETHQNCDIKAAFDDQLTVRVASRLSGVSVTLKDIAYISPRIRVFDSTNFQPVENATVHFLETQNGIHPKRSTAPDISNETPVVSAITDSQGFIAYPKLPVNNPGEQYYISVTPPSPYIWPSEYTNMPSFTQDTVKPHSYGPYSHLNIENTGLFSITQRNQAELFDIPVDQDGLQHKLTLQKDADKDEVEIGSFIQYTLTLKNNLNATLYNAQVFDTLPYGFQYVEGSTRLNGQTYPDPTSVDTYTVRFDLKTLAASNAPPLNGVNKLTYLLKATSGAIDSDGINSAYAQANTATSGADTPLKTNVAKYQVQIRQTGILSTRGIIFGKVYVDANCNNIQDHAEWPIGGVKLYLENGDYVITDENGQYSLFGVKPGIHSLRVDTYTLPNGIDLKPIDNRQAGSGSSRFIDMQRGEMHKANFAAECISENLDQVYAELLARNNSVTGNWQIQEVENFRGLTDNTTSVINENGVTDLNRGTISGPAQSNFRTAPRASTNGGNEYHGYSLEMSHGTHSAMEKLYETLPNNLQKSAYVYPVSPTQSAIRFGFTNKRERLLNLQNQLNDQNIVTTIMPTVYQEIPNTGRFNLNNRLTPAIPKPEALGNEITREEAKSGTWYWPQDEYNYDGRFIAVVRGDVDPTLMVNGQAVRDSRLGERILNKNENAQILGWYGVPLQPGQNNVQITAKDPFGNTRVLLEKTFISPERAANIELSANEGALRADGGQSVIPVNIRLLDENGNLARGTYFVTLDTDQGDLWLNPDIQPNETGHQVRVINGEHTAFLRSTNRTGNIQLTAAVEQFDDAIKVYQIADNRPLFVNGLLSYTGRYGKFDGATPTQQAENYEDEKYTDDPRAAIFMKGQIRGGLHLTLSYDSEKEHEELFRDIAPNSYYPLPGDASIKGYDARSTSKLFAKLERERHFMMWGDYNTAALADSFDLGRTNHVVNGYNMAYDDGEFFGQAYVARPEDMQKVVRFPGNGTAMMYNIGTEDIIRHSDTVVWQVFDRNSPGLILSERILTRYVDYTIDYFTGEMQFNRVVPTYDADLNEVFIQVSFDVDGNGEKYTVAGGRVGYQYNNDLSVGLSYQYNDNKTEGYNIGSFWANYQLDSKTQLALSVATMDHEGSTSAAGITSGSNEKLDSGQAYRVRIRRDWGDAASTDIEYARADESFTNTTGGITSGRQNVRLRHRQRLIGNTNLNIDGTDSQSLTSDERQQAIGLTIDTVIPGIDVRTRLGSRYIHNESGGDNNEFTTGIVGIGRTFTMFNRIGHFDATYEQSFKENQYRFHTKADWQVHDRASIYAQYERQDSLGGIANLGTGRTALFTAGVDIDWLNGSSTYNEFRQRGASDGRTLELANGFRGRFEPVPGISIDPNVEYIEVLRGQGQDGVSVSLGVADVRNPTFKTTGRAEFRHSNHQDYYGLLGAWTTRLGMDWSALVRDELRYTRPDAGENTWKNHLSLGLAYRPRLSDEYNMLLGYEWREEHGETDRMAHIFSTHQNVELSPKWRWSGRLGVKWEDIRQYGQNNDLVTSIFDTRLIYEIDRRWDVDFRGGILSTNGFDSRRYSVGLGASYLVMHNLRLGLGYNFLGFKDKDLDPQGYNLNGVYFDLMFKFDEHLFDWLAE